MNRTHTASSRSHSRGFTLIEMLMVVAIIGILSSVLIASMRDARLKAADSAVRQAASQLRAVAGGQRLPAAGAAGISGEDQPVRSC